MAAVVVVALRRPPEEDSSPELCWGCESRLVPVNTKTFGLCPKCLFEGSPKLQKSIYTDPELGGHSLSCFGGDKVDN